MTENPKQSINVEVAFAIPDEQVIIPISIAEGTNVEEAIIQSGIKERFPQINLEKDKIGIFSKICKKDAKLRDKDRIEIYRPLIADPKEMRKLRAAQGKAMRKGGADSS